MSHSYYLRVFSLPKSELPNAFADHKILEEFEKTHEYRLIVEAKQGDIYWVLEKCVTNLHLDALDYFSENHWDQKIDETWIKWPNADVLANICSDIDALFAIASSNPSALIFDEPYSAEFRAKEEKFIQQSASSRVVDASVKNLLGYDRGEMWDHFFHFLDVFYVICGEAKASNKKLMLVWDVWS